jgi:hypothetical protein
MARHTWVVNVEPVTDYHGHSTIGLAHYHVEDKDGHRIASNLDPVDAPLIAAAPDMLWILKDIYSFLRRSGYDTRMVKATIDKAEREA